MGRERSKKSSQLLHEHEFGILAVDIFAKKGQQLLCRGRLNTKEMSRNFTLFRQKIWSR